MAVRLVSSVIGRKAWLASFSHRLHNPHMPVGACCQNGIDAIDGREQGKTCISVSHKNKCSETCNAECQFALLKIALNKYREQPPFRLADTCDKKMPRRVTRVWMQDATAHTTYQRGRSLARLEHSSPRKFCLVGAVTSASHHNPLQRQLLQQAQVLPEGRQGVGTDHAAGGCCWHSNARHAGVATPGARGGHGAAGQCALQGHGKVIPRMRTLPQPQRLVGCSAGYSFGSRECGAARMRAHTQAPIQPSCSHPPTHAFNTTPHQPTNPQPHTQHTHART